MPEAQVLQEGVPTLSGANGQPAVQANGSVAHPLRNIRRFSIEEARLGDLIGTYNHIGSEDPLEAELLQGRVDLARGALTAWKRFQNAVADIEKSRADDNPVVRSIWNKEKLSNSDPTDVAVVEEIQQRINIVTGAISEEKKNPNLTALWEEQKLLHENALDALTEYRNKALELDRIEKVETQEESSEIEAVAVLEQQQQEANKNRELEQLEERLKDLMAELEAASSDEERKRILKEIEGVQANIDAINAISVIKPPGKQPNRPAESRSVGTHPTHAQPSNGPSVGTRQGDGRASAGGIEGNGARLQKGAHQRIEHELAEIQEPLRQDQQRFQARKDAYERVLESCATDEEFKEQRQKALEEIASFNGRNQKRLERLKSLQIEADGLGRSQLTTAVEDCLDRCKSFAQELESAETTVTTLTLSKARLTRLSQQLNVPGQSRESAVDREPTEVLNSAAARFRREQNRTVLIKPRRIAIGAR